MDVINILKGKQISASSFVPPFAPSNALDGNKDNPIKRWVSNTLPAYLQVDFDKEYLIDQWVVYHMGVIDGWENKNYEMSDFFLQGSLNGINWFTIDTVTDNKASCTIRKIENCRVKYVKLNVTKGLRINKQVASCVEFEVYEGYSTSISDLKKPENSTLEPEYEDKVNSYKLYLNPDTESFKISAILFDPNAKYTITDNETVMLNSISIDKCATKIIKMKIESGPLTREIVFNVFRPDPTLEKIEISDGGKLQPDYSPDKSDGYVVWLKPEIEKYTMTPIPKDKSATIEMKDTKNGKNDIKDYPIISGENQSIEITVTSGIEKRVVQINVLRESTSLSGIGIPEGGVLDPNIQPKQNVYTIFLKNLTDKYTITPVTQDTKATVVMINTKTGKEITNDTQIDQGETQFVEMTVKSGDASEKYNITVIRASDPTIKTIRFNGARTQITDDNCSAILNASSFSITGVAKDSATAIIKYSDVEYSNGATISYIAGIDKVYVIGHSAVGRDSHTYTVNITKV